MRSKGRRGLVFTACLAMPLALSACGGGGGGSVTLQPSVTKSAITVSPPTVTANGLAQAAITVTLYDANGNRVERGGNDVQITSSAGTVGPVTDNGDGTYTADVTSIAPDNYSATFTLDGANSPKAASAAFAAPTAGAESTYMAPWTLETCPDSGECVPSGIYAVDASNPNATPRQLVSGNLMMPPFTSSPPTVDVERVSYDPSTGVVTQLGAGDLIYALGGTLYRLDLTRASASPERLSTLKLTGLCDMYALAPFHSVYDYFGGYAALGQPTLVRVFGFDDPNRTSDDCGGNYTPKEWIIPANGNSTTAPLEVGGESGVTSLITTLADASTGQVEGFLVQSGKGLRLYSPDLSRSTLLNADIFPDGATINNLNDGVSTNILLDVGSIVSGVQHDDLYWVDANGVTPVTTLTASRSDPYFRACLYSGETFYPWRTEDRDGTIYFDYPTSSGFEIEAITAGGTSVQTIYQSQSPFTCDQTLAASTDGKIVFTQYGNTLEWQEVAIAAGGAASQQPQVLLDEPNGELTQYYFSTAGDIAWVADYHCNGSSCSAPTQSMVAVSSDGTSTQSYPNVTLGGQVRQGFLASSGQGLYPRIALAPSSSATCTSTGWKLYDSATLASVASPDFGGSNCAWSARFYGPNESFLFGTVSEQSGAPISAFGLFGASEQAVMLDQYPLPAGVLSVRPIPLF